MAHINNQEVKTNAGNIVENSNEARQQLYAVADLGKEQVRARSAQEQPKHTPSADIFGEIPPYMLEYMKEHGDKNALETSNTTKKKIDEASKGIRPRLADNPHGEREVYDARGGYADPGNKARFEGEPESHIEDVDKVYDYTGKVRDFYKKVFGRDSIDGQGMKIVSTVNYGENVQNAFWDGNKMFYGHPGPSSPFKSFVQLDVTGHEMTHGVTQNESHLWQWAQAGALHEHLSDVFGALVDQYYNNQDADKAEWLHGKGVLKEDVHGKAIRDMLHPGTAYDDPRIGKDPQPDHMDHYYTGPRDNDGVHINSGIPNRAFALFAISMGGKAWEIPGHIWFDARKAAGNNPTFATFAFQTIEQAKKLGRVDVVEKLQDAWHKVGVTPSPTPVASPVASELATKP